MIHHAIAIRCRFVMCERDNGSTPAEARSKRWHQAQVSSNVILKRPFKATIMHGFLLFFFTSLFFFPWVNSQLCTGGTCFTCREMDKYMIKLLV